MGVCYEPFCIVLEYISGGNLLDLLQNKDVMIETKQALSLISQTASGMSHLHSEGVLHLDLSARNILLQRDQSGVIVKISDFGLSALTGGLDYDASDSRMFPVRWTAPEVLLSRKLNKAADIWSFGVVVWEICERKLPYYELNNKEVVEAVCSKGVRLPKPTRISIPNELEQILNRCFSEDPNQRPSFAEICGILRPLVKTQDTQITHFDFPSNYVTANRTHYETPAEKSL